jgi:hypothetical protein
MGISWSVMFHVILSWLDGTKTIGLLRPKKCLASGQAFGPEAPFSFGPDSPSASSRQPYFVHPRVTRLNSPQRVSKQLALPLLKDSWTSPRADH